MKDLDLVVAVAVGGSCGALGRYGLSVVIPHDPASFPAATFVANVLGSLLLGALVVLSVEVWPPNRLARPFAGTGVFGGFTTFSAFSVETRDLLAAGQVATAASYAALSIATALFAVRVGSVATRRLAHVDPEDQS